MKILFLVGLGIADFFHFLKEFLQYFKKKLKKDAPFRTCFILVWLFSLILVPAKGISAFGIFLAAVGIGTLFVLITIFAIIMISGSENEE